MDPGVVGSDVGRSVGKGVGRSVGECVGECVGKGVGVAVVCAMVAVELTYSGIDPLHESSAPLLTSPTVQNTSL